MVLKKPFSQRESQVLQMPTRLRNKRIENKQWKNMIHYHHGQRLAESLTEPSPRF